MRLHLLTAIPDNNFRASPRASPGPPPVPPPAAPSAPPPFQYKVSPRKDTKAAVEIFKSQFDELNNATGKIEKKLRALLQDAEENSDDPQVAVDLEYVMRELEDYNTKISKELISARERLDQLPDPRLRV